VSLRAWFPDVHDGADDHHARTVAAGATVVQELVEQPYGSREWAAVDGEDNRLSFGTHRPGAAGIVEA
jgi:uncharacterized glyoxalase superfamily protein PhnB